MGAKRVAMPRLWDSDEGRWVFVVNAVGRNRVKQDSGSEEVEPIATNIGVDISAVRKRYF